ncbi:MAG: hypothetical protein WCF12_04730 [Propionicimonas sp.]
MHNAVVEQGMNRVAVGLVTLNLAVSVTALIRWPDSYVGLTAPVALGALAVTSMWCAKSSFRMPMTRWPIAILVTICYLAMALHPALLTPAAPPYPPLFPVLGAGMCATGVAFGTTYAAVLVPAFCAWVAYVRAPRAGAPTSISEAILLLLSGAIGVALVHLARKSASQATLAVEDEWDLREQSVRAQREAAERSRWDRLVHDKVLGALLIAGRSGASSVPPAARELAAEAKATLDGRHASNPGSARDEWRSCAQHHGLTLVMDLVEHPADDDVLRSVISAGKEALVNTERHSGQSTVAISGTIDVDHISVVIADRGRGFVTDTRSGRSGIRFSIEERMRAIGGGAVVTSAPDAGTQVALSWERQLAEPVPTSPQWSYRPFAPLLVLGAAVCLANLAFGARHWALGPAVPLNVLGVVALVSLSIATVLEREGKAARWAMWAGPGIIATGLAALQGPSAVPDWRHWYLGALTPAFAVMAFRSRPWVGLGSALVALTGSSIVTYLSSGLSAVGVLLGAAPVLLGSVVAGQLLKRSLDRSWGIVRQAARESGELRLAIASADARAREASRRIEELSTAVGGELGLLISDQDLTTESRQDLLLVEASLRDQMTAPGLLDRHLLECLTAARRRGLRIDVASSETSGVAQPGGGLRELIAGTLAALEPPATARISWRPEYPSARLTITCVGEGIEKLPSIWHQTSRRFRIASVASGDDDCLMLEVP